MNLNFDNIYIDEIEDLADMVMEDVDTLGKFGIVGVVGHSYDIADIFKELMCHMSTYPNFIKTLDATDENSEYFLCVDEEGNVDIELVKDSETGKYIDYCADKLYIFGDCHSNICANNYVKDCDYYIVEYANNVKDSDSCQKEYKGNCSNCKDCGKSTKCIDSSTKIDVTRDKDDSILGVSLDKHFENGHASYEIFNSVGLSDEIIDSLVDILDILE